MLCSNCQSPLKPDAQFCASCGLKFKKEAPNNPKTKPPFNKTPYLILGLLAALGLGYSIQYNDASIEKKLIALEETKSEGEKAFSPSAVSTRSTQLLEPIHKQLKALYANSISTAYNDYTSTEFKNATSQNDFQTFINSFPILVHYNTISTIEALQEGNKGFVIISLGQGDGKITFVEYTLTQENDQWKIEAININNGQQTVEQLNIKKHAAANPSSKAAKLFVNEGEASKIISTTDRQLHALLRHEIARAYQDYTSKEFQQSTSLEKYTDGVKQHSLISNYSDIEYDFNTLSINDNHANISVTLLEGRKSLTIDYSLVKVGEGWKIWGSEIVEADELADAASDKSVSSDKTSDINQIIETVKGQLNGLKGNDVSKAYNEYTAPDFQKATSFPAFQEFVKKYSILTQYNTVSFGDVTFKDDKASVMAILLSSDVSNPVEYTLVKVDNQWKIFGFKVLVPEGTLLTSADKGDILAVVGDQLTAIKNNDIDKAYSYTSKEFREATSQKAFEDFVKHYTILKDYKSSSFSNINPNHQTVLLTATLSTPENNADIEYRLVKEGNAWKIWSLNIVRNTATATRPSSVKSADLLRTIDDQLTAIRAQDIAKAYQTYTAKGFKEITSQKDFEDFVHKNPVIAKNKSSSFGNLSFEDDIGVYEGTLTSTDGETEPVKYRLIFEDNQWKILSINILYSLQPVSQNLEFTKAVLGNEVDLKGMVIKPLTVFKADDSKITVNVYVHNGSVGTKIDIIMEHVESASRVPVVSTTLETEGDSIASFVFTPPTQGWPKGNYKLYVSSSTNVQAVYTFKVE